MDDTKLLIGSLSNDLYRVATLAQRKSFAGAQRFLDESKHWVVQLQKHEVKEYIKTILEDLAGSESKEDISVERAEKYLMYSILLQNYALHLKS